MYFFNKKIKILRGFALVCVLALGLCLTGGLQIAEAKQQHIMTHRQAGCTSKEQNLWTKRGMKYSFAESAHMD